MKRHVSAFSTLFALLAVAMLGRAESAAAKPNIIVVLADDKGYGDLGC